MRRDVRRSIWFVIVAGGGYLTLLTYFTGWQGLLLYFVAPWFAIHTWFSITTLMHHSCEDIPYLPEECWTRNASKLLVTTDYVYPRWLLFLTHNISLHTAHHVAPAMPCYNLRKAQAALRTEYPEMVRVEKVSAAQTLEHPAQMPVLRPDLGSVLHTSHATRRIRRPGSGVSGSSLLAAGLARAHRILPRAAGYVHTAMFVNTRGLGDPPDDVCPLGARRVEVAGVPRVAAVYVWGSDEPTVLALHGWGADSTTMSAVVDVAVANGESAICFDAPGHGVSPGSQATITEYANATAKVLQRFPSIHTVVAHSLASIAAVSAVAESGATNVRAHAAARSYLLAVAAYSTGGPRNEACPPAWSH